MDSWCGNCYCTICGEKIYIEDVRKPSKINGLQAFSTLEIVIFLRFDTNLTPIFSFLVSEVHCHTIQLCYLIFNPCPVAQVVIHFHSHIKMSVSHDVLV